MCRREGPATRPAPKGSFAGAIGLPQFMPGSINRYAVDFDGDGRIDLHDSAADVIGSVAHYLAAYGWQRGMADALRGRPCRWTPRQRATLLQPDILPSFSAAADGGAGRRARRRRPRARRARWRWSSCRTATPRRAIVAGTQNFYAVTRYNWSSYYAMAVIELGEAVRRQR